MAKKNAETTFVLEVPMHCRCDGCGDKIRAAVRDLLRCEGVVSLDQSALATKGEVTVVATAGADPERLRHRLRKATGKSVGLVFPKPPADGAKDDAAAALQLQALLAALALQVPQPVHAHRGQPTPTTGAWNGGYVYGQAYASPWDVQLQRPAYESPLEPYLAPYHAYPHSGAASFPTTVPSAPPLPLPEEEEAAAWRRNTTAPWEQ